MLVLDGNGRPRRLGVSTLNMTQAIRRLLSALSACGIAASILAYIRSLSEATIDDELRWVIALGIAALALQVPIVVLEHSTLENRTFFWKGFSLGMPRWVVPCVMLFWLIAIAHFVWFFLQTSAAVPIMNDGQYILSSRGRIVRVLTETEFLTFKAGELRVFAALMIACYFMPTMYWWFPQSRQVVD